MALNLSKTGIVDGQIITAAQISQSIDALTAAAAYNITISGSFSMGTKTTGSGYYANAVAANTIRPQNLFNSGSKYIIPYLASTGSTSALYYSATGPLYDPVTDILQTTASLAITASYAQSTGTVSSVSAQLVQNGVTPPIIASTNFIAGSATLAGGVAPYTVTVSLVSLIGKVLGTTAFPVATYTGSAGTTPPGGQAVQVDSLNSFTGDLTFSGPVASTFYFHIIYT